MITGQKTLITEQIILVIAEIISMTGQMILINDEDKYIAQHAQLTPWKKPIDAKVHERDKQNTR